MAPLAPAQARAAFPGLSALPPLQQEERLGRTPHAEDERFSEWAAARGVLLPESS